MIRAYFFYVIGNDKSEFVRIFSEISKFISPNSDVIS